MHHGIAANGMPYAIAMVKGYFKQAGADVSGIISSQGGGTTIRNLIGGKLDYGEVDLAGAVAAIQQGADLKIISDNVLTVGEFVWAVRPDSRDSGLIGAIWRDPCDNVPLRGPLASNTTRRPRAIPARLADGECGGPALSAYG
jgi:hypothetical protein